MKVAGEVIRAKNSLIALAEETLSLLWSLGQPRAPSYGDAMQGTSRRRLEACRLSVSCVTPVAQAPIGG